MATKKNGPTTRELLKAAQTEGVKITSVWSPQVYGEIKHSPRTKYDPKPWLSANGYRFHAWELTAEENEQ